MTENHPQTRILAWVRSSNFKRVALQYPPSLAWQAPDLASRLQAAEPGVEFFVLGDTSYGDCCVDEVNAAHYGADCIIHFGYSCQSRPQRLPVLYVFWPCPEELPALNELQTKIANFNPGFESVLVFCDPSFANWEFPIISVLSASGRFPGGVHLAKLQDEFRPDRTSPVISDRSLFRSSLFVPTRKSTAEISACNRPVFSATPGGKLIPREFPIDKSAISVFFVGPESSPLLERLLVEYSEVWQMSGNSSIFRAREGGRLMRRYAGVERVKTAERVGVLYAASSLSELSKTRETLSRMLRAQGKKVEGFCVGKLTEEKLGNFPEIDCFVVLGCPDFINTEILPRAKNFHCPLVTAYEVLLACGHAEWDGTFSCSPAMPEVSDFFEEDLLQSLIALENRGWVGLTEEEVSIPPAVIEPGLDGIPARYRSEVARS